MSETLRVWIEVAFNLSYLVGVWALVGLMARRQKAVAPADRPVATRLMWAFALLALGDTGHVGFRVVAYAQGGLETQPGLVGIGALATAVTVTLFYVLMLDIWRLRFKQQLGWFGWLLLGAAAARLIVMAFPQNDWSNSVPPFGWSLARNALLTVQGLGVLYLIGRDARAAHDRPFSWIAIMILISYVCFAPVIFFAPQYPLVGMLMIPKTLAYLAIAVIGYLALFPRPAAR